jgi:membrane protein required for colicin V production
MSRIDWLIAAVILISVLAATAQGFLYEAFSLGGSVVAYVVAAWGYSRVAVWFAPYVASPWVANIAGFLAIFVSIVLLAGIVGRIARWSASGSALRWVDRLLGGVFGFVRGIVIGAVLLMALTAFSPDNSGVTHSTLGPYVLMVARTMAVAAPAQLRERFRSGLKASRLHAQSDSADVNPGKN